MPKGVPGSRAPHGTLTRYMNHGCRCDECRTANREYYRAHRGHRPRDVYDAERAAQHGTESKYTAGCRCEFCVKASSAARRLRRQANIEAARAYDHEYKRRRRAQA